MINTDLLNHLPAEHRATVEGIHDRQETLYDPMQMHMDKGELIRILSETLERVAVKDEVINNQYAELNVIKVTSPLSRDELKGLYVKAHEDTLTRGECISLLMHIGAIEYKLVDTLERVVELEGKLNPASLIENKHEYDQTGCEEHTCYVRGTGCTVTNCKHGDLEPDESPCIACKRSGVDTVYCCFEPRKEVDADGW